MLFLWLADYRRRNSIGRENIVASLRDQEDKENGKDQNWKPARAQSPASSKGVKNFMSPTISAASKINASPRKKILVERNEPIHTSVSVSSEKSSSMEDLDAKPEKGLKQRKEVSFDSTITYLGDEDAPKGDEDIDFEVHSSTDVDLDSAVTGEKDRVNLDPSFEISPRSSVPSPALASLDGDASMPPYDPKTNYLSPRPQFLHYRPNPRIEVYLNKEMDVQQLDESFASESFTDSEVTEEETQSDDSQKESEDASSGDAVKAGEEEKEQLVSAPNPISSAEGAAEAKRVSKPPFFTRARFNALLLVLAVACLCVSVTFLTIMDPSVLNNLSFSELHVPPEISEFTRFSFESLAHKLQQWLYRSLTHISNLITSFRERHKLGPLRYANLTTLIEDGLVVNDLMFDHSISEAEVKYEKSVLGPIREGEIGIKSLVEEGQPLETEEEDIGEVIEGDNNDQGFEEQEENVACDNFEVSLESSFLEYEEVNVLKSEEVNMLLQAEVTEPGNSVVEVTQERVETVANTVELGNSLEEVTQERVETTANIVDLQSDIEQPVPIPQAARQPQGKSDMSSAEIKSIVAENNLENLDSYAAKENPQSLDSADLTHDRLQESFSGKIIVGIFLPVLGLLAAVAFIYMKNKKPTTSNTAFTLDQVPMTTKLDYSHMSVPAKYAYQERLSSRNWQTEVDMVGESCPSEMSSFENSLSYSSKKGQKGTSENHSHERKPRKNYRRESMASSDYSMGSPSYGSFTTYEKIPSKHVSTYCHTHMIFYICHFQPESFFFFTCL